ncbi:MAG: glycosyltransferase family 4 protein [Cytophaga sp.]|uniref:glycosyltransferase family 4 protein n=1 Tax=Cytophaga sp. TaxID=29535 RepID=UPI003F7FD837
MIALYLSLFDKTGGIERFNRSFSKALENTISSDTSLYVFSLYDNEKTVADSRYISKASYQGFANKKRNLISRVLPLLRSNNTIILGHINYAPLMLLLKCIKPSLKFILIVHGIDVWRDLSFLKRKCLQHTDQILSVSNYTKSVLVNKQGVDSNKITVFPNTVDALFDYPSRFERPVYLQNRHTIASTDKVVFTLTRLSSTEHFKGYDKVIESVIQLKKRYPNLQYLIGGKADETEYARLTSMIQKANAQEYIKLCGFIPEQELTDYYLLSDVFIIPSKKEGFGIVFIEAMVCGLKVIAGNQDGSVDALQNGELGLLVHPDNQKEIEQAIEASIQQPLTDGEKQSLQIRVKNLFGFDAFQNRLKHFLVSNHVVEYTR